MAAHRIRMIVILSTILIAGASSSAAGAAGPVVGSLVGGGGVADAAHSSRYVALRAGANTEVVAIGLRDGSVSRSRLLPGRWGIPLIAQDGSAGGISADGHTLVLAQTTPVLARTSRFVTVDPESLRLRRVVRLRGSFSYDALSPDGARLYLIQHVSRQDVSEYAVRAYDLDRGRLLRRVIADRRTWGPTMHGYPVTRTTSADGRWAYTLYMSASGVPFVHALDTVKARARCIDIPWQGSQDDVWSLTLRLAGGGRKLVVSLRNFATPVAVVDTRTLRVQHEPPARSEPSVATPSSRFATRAAVGVAAPVALLVALGIIVLRGRRRPEQPTG
jgi:hypothetical protein